MKIYIHVIFNNFTKKFEPRKFGAMRYIEWSTSPVLVVNETFTGVVKCVVTLEVEVTPMVDFEVVGITSSVVMKHAVNMMCTHV